MDYVTKKGEPHIQSAEMRFPRRTHNVIRVDRIINENIRAELNVLSFNDKINN